MNGKERVEALYSGGDVDRLPIGEDIWGTTLKLWREQGHLGVNEEPADHFDFDFDRAGLIRCDADLDGEWETIEKTDETITVRDLNRATLRQYTTHAGALEHIDFFVKDRTNWGGWARPLLVKMDTRRIPFESYRKKKKACDKAGRHFQADSFGPFEMMHRITGHENMLMGMALDPDWVKDMVNVYMDLNINHLEELFSKEGLPDSVWMAEDLGFKQKPFMSPDMFRDIMLPGYVRFFDFLHSKGLRLMMHSCGFIEPLLPQLIEAGLDCLEAMEFKAGMYLPDLFKKYGDAIAWCGNLDIRVFEKNDPALIDPMLDEIVKPVIDGGGRFFVHSDHSISEAVEYNTYKAFVEKAKAIKPRKTVVGR